VPFKVNANATVKAQQGTKTVSINVTANTIDTMLIVSEGVEPVLEGPGRTQKPVTMHSSRGKLSLELSSQFYKSTEISLYSLNGKRVLYDRVSAAAAAKNISHPNIATGVYVLYVKGGGNNFSTRLAHHGGGMNIDVSFGGVFSPLRKDDAGAFGIWDITVSATEHLNHEYQLNIDIGLNPTQRITLLGIPLSSSSADDTGISSSSVDEPSSSSADEPSSSSADAEPSSSSSSADEPSSSSADEPSSSSDDNGDSSSSVETPKCGEVEYDPTTEFCQEATNMVKPLCNGEIYQSSHICENGELIHENCLNFTDGTKREHEGKEKAQFCDVRDGTKYVYVNIGDQFWMAENLKYVVENSGCYGDIGVSANCGGTNKTTLSEEEVQANCAKYGRLYTWPAAYGRIYTLLPTSDDLIRNIRNGSNTNPSGIQGICPSGWHLPSKLEWEQMINYSENTTTKLKATSDWFDGNGANGTDDYGFSALPGGQSSVNSLNASCYAGSQGSWWSTSTNSALSVQLLSMNNNNANASWSNSGTAGNSSNTATGYRMNSVRCVKDPD